MIFKSPRRHSRARASAPQSVGQKFTGRVRDVSAVGHGVVAHASGQVFFIPGVWLNELVEVRVTGFQGRFGHGELVRLLEPSPHRIDPPCPYQGFTRRDCGGCPWQFVTYDAQLQAKQNRVADALADLAPADVIKPIWPSTAIFGYRNRAQFKTDGERLGYMAARSNALVDVGDCPVLTEPNRRTLSVLRRALPNKRWKPKKRNRLTTIDIDEEVDAQTASTNARLPFQQGNSQQNMRMRTWLSERLSRLDMDAAVLELFAGAGNFTEVIVEAGFRRVIAMEGDEAALQTLAQALPSVEPVRCDLFSDAAAGPIGDAVRETGVLVLDPPRDGLKNDCLKSREGIFHKKSRIHDLFYISCNPATLRRDLTDFVGNGYVIREVQPLDQFPHTPHIELLVHLTRC